MIVRTLLTAATLLFAVGLFALMLKGWRSRQHRQADLPAPLRAAPGAEVLLGPVPGLFVGTTSAGDWLDRIVVHHLSDRARASLTVATDGLHVLREGCDPLLLPVVDLDGASIEAGLAGKVLRDGLLVVTWRLGERTLASAFRADDPADHELVVDALTTLFPSEAHR